MLTGANDADYERREADYRERCWQTAYLAMMIHNTTRAEASECKPSWYFFEQLTGERQEPPEMVEDDPSDTSSTAELKRRRAERERANGQQIQH